MLSTLLLVLLIILVITAVIIAFCLWGIMQAVSTLSGAVELMAKVALFSVNRLKRLKL
jgi:hypothetical protein